MQAPLSAYGQNNRQGDAEDVTREQWWRDWIVRRTKIPVGAEGSLTPCSSLWDIASLAIFRILFGGILVFEVWRFFEHDWIRKYYIDRIFYFKYIGFEWVHPWPGDGMYYHFLAVGLVRFLRHDGASFIGSLPGYCF